MQPLRTRLRIVICAACVLRAARKASRRNTSVCTFNVPARGSSQFPPNLEKRLDEMADFADDCRFCQGPW